MSTTSDFVYLLMQLLRYRQRNGKRFREELSTPNLAARLTPAELPPKLEKKFETDRFMVRDHRVFTLASTKDPQSTVSLFFHGGAFIRKAVPLHWGFITRWLDRFGGTVVFPDYPLAPEYSCAEILPFTEEVYLKIAEKTNPANIILMGDSSGGGLSFALRQLIRDGGHPAPAHTLLFSPWIDLVMEDPEIDAIEKSDPMLPARELRLAGKAYAGGLDLHDPRVSPIHGNLEGLGSLSLFTGTREILLPGARRMRDICAARGIPLNYFEYPQMIHDWMLLPLPEAGRVLDDIGKIIGK